MRDLKGFRSEMAKLKDSSGTMLDCRPSGGRICGIVERGELQISEHALTHMSSLKEKPVGLLKDKANTRKNG
jgi:hypothetical protein